jgi:hypothetical protein
MGETLNQRRRVQEEGLRVVNCFYGGRTLTLIEQCALRKTDEISAQLVWG